MPNFMKYLSKEAPLVSTVGFSSNLVCISGIFDNNCALHERLERNLDWEDVKSLLPIK